jgi:uncharacterized protein (TIGR04255 family)
MAGPREIAPEELTQRLESIDLDFGSMMTSPERPQDLPDYSDPPVDEVIVAIAFMSVGGSTSNHIAKYRDTVKEAYPGLQYQPKLPVQLERLVDEGWSGQPPMGIPFGGMPLQMGQMGQRTWLVSTDDQRLIQIQDDAFYTNWRRRVEPYPRFESILKEFWDRFSEFRSQLDSDTVIPLQLQQIEVSYINWIPREEFPLEQWFLPANVTKIECDGTTTLPEHHQWAASYPLNKDHVPVARLHVRQLEALRTGPGAPHLGSQFELTYRAPLAPGVSDDEISELALHARGVIVKAFTDLTTEDGHKRWGQTN